MRSDLLVRFIGPLLLLSACSPSRQEVTVRLEPLTHVQARSIQVRLRTGVPILPDEHIDEDSTTPAEACRAFMARLGSGIQKDYLEVPEDWANPSGRKIKIFYYARIARDAQGRMLQPVVFFNGGPGGDSHSSYDILEKQDAAKSLSLIYLDQRGTGCSDPYPAAPVTAATARELALYGSRGIVQDAEAVRARLFGQGSRWHVFGQSFGGYIVHRYVQVAPQGVDGAFAHGSSLMSDTIEWLVLRIRSQHRVGEDYFAQFPEDRAALDKARSQIPANLCFEDGTNRVCGGSVLDAATILLGFHDEWTSLHHWIGALLPSDGTLDRDVLHKFVQYFVFGVYAENGFAASVISSLELAPGVSDSAGCAQVMQRLEAAGESPASWSVNECRLLSAMKSPWDPIVDAMQSVDPLTSEGVLASLQAHPEIPFHLYSGEKDVFVPVETFAEEVSKMGSRIDYRDFPNSGHDGFYTEPQVWADLKR